MFQVSADHGMDAEQFQPLPQACDVYPSERQKVAKAVLDQYERSQPDAKRASDMLVHPVQHSLRVF